MINVVPLKDAADPSQFGGKAHNLARLLQNGLPVPDGLAVALRAFNDDGALIEQATAQIRQYLCPDKLYAVRSSALAEDAQGASWAGQFETFLDTKPKDVLAKVEQCHASAKARAKAYAKDKSLGDSFDVAVVIQEMLTPDYAGVLFTRDPLTGANTFVTEYVEGLGEKLVSGQADPRRIIWEPSHEPEAPFDAKELATLAKKIEEIFGVPQDIEWACEHGKIWIVQARPITTLPSAALTQQPAPRPKASQGVDDFSLGKPDELFYWGPSRAKPMYMSDFMAAIERLFEDMSSDPDLPNPPKTLVLFAGDKMVWLNNAQEFAGFTMQTFEAYDKSHSLDEDIANWKAASARLGELSGSELAEALTAAWYHTELAEFSLYGAEAAITKRLARFDPTIRQSVWGAFTVPDKPTFLARIDAELASSRSPSEMAIKYPWIQDGYDGPSANAGEYFEKRLEMLGDDGLTNPPSQKSKRAELIKVFALTTEEVSALNLARRLAEFMDDRKAWMMQTRRLITQPVGGIRDGWFFNDGVATNIDHGLVHQLWRRYIDFRASTSAVVGIVASSGGRHFVDGEIVVVTSPTDPVKDGKIVVVPSTSPSYVPLMRKAKALITDHGGMMSHAAIVAREFNLPCIVGTKQATKVLRAGDKVVLNLVTGEVSKR